MLTYRWLEKANLQFLHTSLLSPSHCDATLTTRPPPGTGIPGRHPPAVGIHAAGGFFWEQLSFGAPCVMILSREFAQREVPIPCL